MIEFFVFLGCFAATAALGAPIVYLGALIVAAFICLYIYNKKKPSEAVQNFIISGEPIVGGVGLFVVAAGILFLSRNPLDPETSATIVNAVKILGVVLISALFLSPIAIAAYKYIKK